MNEKICPDCGGVSGPDGANLVPLYDAPHDGANIVGEDYCEHPIHDEDEDGDEG